MAQYFIIYLCIHWAISEWRGKLWGEIQISAEKLYFIKKFYNLENFALCCSWIAVVYFAKGFPFLTHCIFQVQGCMFLCAWSCAASLPYECHPYYDLWLWYSNLCPSPIKKKKYLAPTRSLWWHVGSDSLTKVWTGTLQSPVVFLPLKSRARYSDIQPDIQESRPRMSDSTYYLIVPRFQYVFLLHSPELLLSDLPLVCGRF